MDATTINDQSDEFSWKSALKTYVGETLELTGVLRQEMGTCLCIDSNNVPPTVSKRYSVQVHCKQNKNLPSTVAARATELFNGSGCKARRRQSATPTCPMYHRYLHTLSAEFSEEHTRASTGGTSNECTLVGDIDGLRREESARSETKAQAVCLTPLNV
ncbi:uncharacterized protein LOC126870318 [Bombus huntii]|uniref:uncharacterized protein LOC126870318 n=1 Tax=Bombus huntii TaxID=85661 RepID=UPI0021A9AAD4|nr:uncharacterized protein LOC126870318 [Bombus huntii]